MSFEIAPFSVFSHLSRHAHLSRVDIQQRASAVLKTTHHSISLTVPADLAALEPMRGALGTLARSHELTASVAARLQIVMDELLSNIITHGLQGVAPHAAPITVSMTLSGKVFTAVLTDRGPPFDPSQAPFPDDALRPRIGGRGIDLMGALADRITHSLQDGRNVTTVSKTLMDTPDQKDLPAMAPGLTISETRNDGAATIALGGRIDSGNAPQLTTHLTEVVRAGHPDIVLDLAALEYLTSAGFRTFLIVSDAAEELGGELSLTNLSADVQDLFDLSGLTQAFRMI